MDRVYGKIFDCFRSALPVPTDQIIERTNQKKCVTYLLDLERQGITTTTLYHLLSEAIIPHEGKDKLLKGYYEDIAIERGNEDAILAMSKCYAWSIHSMPNANKAILILKDAIHKYGITHGSIVNNTINNNIINNNNTNHNNNNEMKTFSSEVKGRICNHRLWNMLFFCLQFTRKGVPSVSLGEFTSAEEMSLYYSDILIKYGGYNGYVWKCSTYRRRGTCEGNALAKRVGEEADQKGKANSNIYQDLIQMYMYVPYIYIYIYTTYILYS